MKHILFTFVALSISVAAHGALLPIVEDTQYVLGSGVEPITGLRKETCIEFDDHDIKFEDGNDLRALPGDRTSNPGRGSAEFRVITSNTEAYSFLNIDVAAKASLLAFSGGGSYSKADKSYQRSDRMSIGLTTVHDYGRFEIKSYRLKPRYAEMAARTDKTDFYRACGREFVVGYRMGQGLKVLLTSSDELSESYHHVKATMEAKTNVGIFSGSASASFEQTAQEMLKYGRLEISYRGYGMGPLRTTATLLTSNTEVKSFGDKIADYISTMDPNQAVKTHYITRSYEETMGDYDQLAIDVRRHTIGLLYGTYVSIRDDYDRLVKVTRTTLPYQVRSLCETEGVLTCSEYIALLDKKKVALEKARAKVIEQIRKCVQVDRLSECRELDIGEMYPDLQSQIIWPKQYRQILWEAFLKRQMERN